MYMGRSGGAGMFKTTNAGLSWTDINTGSLSGFLSGIDALVIDPTNPLTVYAGGRTGSTTLSAFVEGVFKTINGGTSWTTSNNGLTNTDVRAMALNAANPSIVYAGTFGGGVFKSNDGASTWAAAIGGLSNLNILSLAIDRLNPATHYAGTSGGGIFKAPSSGANWSAINSGLFGLTVQAIAVDPTSSSTVY